jgi:hypothetical protein
MHCFIANPLSIALLAISLPFVHLPFCLLSCRRLLHAVMVLVGNKTDLAEQREVSEEEARAFADRCACRMLWRPVALPQHSMHTFGLNDPRAPSAEMCGLVAPPQHRMHTCGIDAPPPDACSPGWQHTALHLCALAHPYPSRHHLPTATCMVHAALHLSGALRAAHLSAVPVRDAAPAL